MTNEEANEIRLHLIDNLEKYGYGDIVRDVNTKLEEQLATEDNFSLSNRSLLDFYLYECIDALESLSNDKFPDILNRFNKFIETDGKPIRSISLELINDNEKNKNIPKEFELSQLPSYREIIQEFREILEITQSENQI